MVHPTETSSSARRPLKSRGVALFRNIAMWLAARGISANSISVAGIFFALLGGVVFAAVSGMGRAAWIAGAAFVQLRLLCNLLDGLVAVEGGKGTATGAFFNEAPDRLADVLILIGFGAAAGEWMLGLTAALFAVGVAYLRILGAELGTGHWFGGPMAKPHRMALLTFSAIAFAMLPAAWWKPGVQAALALLIAGCVVTMARRIVRILGKLQAAG